MLFFVMNNFFFLYMQGAVKNYFAKINNYFLLPKTLDKVGPVDNRPFTN